MIIQHIHIARFGRIQDFDCDFSSAVNIIEGNNESGKTTLLSFIKFMLYGADSGKAKGLSERQLILPWGSTSAQGSMTLLHNSESFRIERELSRSTSDAGKESWHERIVVYRVSNGEVVLKDQSPGTYFLGVPASVFASTSFVGQLAGAPVNGAELTSSVGNLLTSADETVSTKKALAAIESARRLLQYRTGSGGEIPELEAEEASVRARLQTSQDSAKDIRALEKTVADCDQKMAENRAAINDLAHRIDGSRAVDACRRFDILHAHEHKLAALDKELDEMPGGDSRDEGLLAVLDARRQDFDSAEKARDAAVVRMNSSIRPDVRTDADDYVREVNDIGGKEAAEYSFDHHLHLRKSLTSGAVTLFIFALVLVGVAALLYFAFHLEGLIPLFVIGGAAALVIGGIVCLLLRGQHVRYVRHALEGVGADKESLYLIALDNLFEIEQIRDQQKKEAEEARQAAEQSELRLENAADALRDAYVRTKNAFGIIDPAFDSCTSENILSLMERIRARIDARSELLKERARQQTALDMSKEQLGDLDEKTVREQAELTDQTILKGTIPTLRRELDFLTSQNAAISEKKLSAEKKLAAQTAIREDPSVLAKRLEEISLRLDVLRPRLRALNLASEALGEAESHLQGGFVPRIRGRACELMSAFTDHRYEDLRVGSDYSLSFTIDGITRESDYLSAGTRDLAYLSLRISLAEEIFRSSASPLFFDETFARLDDDRLSNLLRKCYSLGRSGKQLFIFTCQRREAASMGALDYKRITLTRD